ncbi:MAG: family 10 glycosylhydrolase [Bacteroidota bacterium]|nr:family 10 glycosylhydrolase [Bacteroidota bacterium]
MMKNFTEYLLRVLIALVVAVSINSAQKRETRGAWIATVTNIDWPSPATTDVEVQKTQLRTILDKLSASGVNIAIFQIRPECDALYNSPYEPWSKWLTGTQGSPPNPFYDPLQFVVEEAHKRGMELHAWFNPYRAERSAGNYSTAANHVTNTHPDWVLQVGTVRFLNPGLQEVRDYDTKVICDVVRRYDIDAAHMDDYFYVEPMGSQDANTFATYPRGFTVLGDWRRDNVNLLIKQVYDSIQIIKPWVKWGISPRGIWKNGVPTGIIGNDNYSTIYCDATAWLSGNYIDYLAPQLYWKIGGSQDFTKLLPWWISVSNGRQIIPGLAAYRILTGVNPFTSASEILNQIRFERSTPPIAGNFLYTTFNITGNLDKLTDSLVNDLYKFKALVPSLKWKDSLAPNPPLNVQFGRFGSSPIATINWSLPVQASDNDSASLYVIYKSPSGIISQNDIDDPKNIFSVTSNRNFNPYSINNGAKNFALTSLDRNHNESAPSSVVSIDNLPKQPMLVFPSDLAMNQIPGVKLLWNYADSSSAYQIQVSADSTFSSVVTNSVLYDTSFTTINLKGEQRYFWQVKGLNIAGAGNYSIARNFSTGNPADPPLVAPADLLTNTPLLMKFSWNKTPMTQSFAFQLSLSSDFLNSVIKDTIGFLDTSITVENLLPFKIYFWRVKGFNPIGTSDWAFRKFRTQTSAFVAMNDVIPTEYGLEQNFPNPFNPSTTILISVKNYGPTSVKVFDVLGREVEALVDGDLAPGQYSLQFNASRLSSGFYFVVMRSGEFASVKKMLYQK